MTETRIIELLQQIHGSNEENMLKFNECSRLIPEHVDQISKFMANAVYETLNENSSSSNSKRMNFIQLLRRWCPRDDNHFNIDGYNCEFLLDIYNKEEKTDEITTILNTLQSNCENLPSDEVLDALKDYYDRNDIKTAEKLKHLEHIKEMDQEKLENNEFFESKGNIKLDKIDNFLNDFVCNKQGFHEILEMKSSQKSLNISRENRIKLVYSLLNLKQNQKLRLLLKSIVNEIASESGISLDEMELVIYLWKNKEIKYEFNILKLFPFIYEKPLINLCNQLVNSTGDNKKINYIEIFKQDHKELIENIKTEDEVKFKVINLLNELFILSNYNEIILDIVRVFNTH